MLHFRWKQSLCIFIVALSCLSVDTEAISSAQSKIQNQAKPTVDTPGCFSLPESVTGEECMASTPNERKIAATLRHAFLSAFSVSVPSYYLIWSPGSGRKFLISTLGLGCFHLYQDILWNKPQHPLVTNLLLPLLSSACCAIQLILNVLGVGCGGFNTLLGPFRAYFLSLLLYLSVIVYPPTNGKEALTVLARMVMALLPELVHLWNTYQTTARNNNSNYLKPPHSLSGKIQATVQLIVPTMGCVACINKINSSLQQAFPNHSNYLTGSAWLVPEGGRASITLQADNETELERLVEQARNAIHAAGFPGTSVESMQRQG